MCRLLSISGKIKYSETLTIAKKFRQLAEDGNVPTGTSRGHKDGWGIMAYEKGAVFLFSKNYHDAFADAKYLKIVEGLGGRQPNIIIGHLRKAFVGAKNVNNAQPFVEKNYAFCHNGTILTSEKIPLKNKFKKIIKGETDSEKFFAFLMQLLAEYKKPTSAVIRCSIRKAVNYVRKNSDFTAINMIFSNGKITWAMREINEKNSTVIEKKLIDYYSLYIGKGNLCRIVSSEKLALKNIKWKPMRNHELIQMSAENMEVFSWII